MLSILIPVYNWDIRELIAELHRQCLETGIGFEILCFDDGSKTDFKLLNRSVSKLTNVIYKELPQNQGRSKIRNLLGKSAKHDYLLFMDCDSGIVSDRYLSEYLKHLKSDALLYGGTVYQGQPPATEHLLHWVYGKNREQTSAKQRELKPYHSFKTNNFLIPRKVFLQFLFDENLTQYGHEDTIFGLLLQASNISIIHLDNPLEHRGLEKTETFLSKTRQGVENLWYLSQQYQLIDTKLLRAHQKVKRTGLVPFFYTIFRLCKARLIRSFHSRHPNLRFFDFYKLGILIEISRKAN